MNTAMAMASSGRQNFLKNFPMLWNSLLSHEGRLRRAAPVAIAFQLRSKAPDLPPKILPSSCRRHSQQPTPMPPA
jgi:hypothetical protein